MPKNVVTMRGKWAGRNQLARSEIGAHDPNRANVLADPISHPGPLIEFIRCTSLYPFNRLRLRIWPIF